MAIIDRTAQPEEALTYSHIFMDELVVSQGRVEVASDNPRYQVRLKYRKFAIDSADTIHYAKLAETITIQDYYPEALAKAMEGDPDMINALGAIQAAIAAIISEKSELEAEVL